MENNDRLFWGIMLFLSLLLLLTSLIDLLSSKSKSCGCANNPHRHIHFGSELSESEVAELKALAEAENKRKDEQLTKSEKKDLLLSLQIDHYRRQAEIAKKNGIL